MNRVQQLFATAVEIPLADRDAWLVEQCGIDAKLLARVRALLANHDPDVDPLEDGLQQVIADLDVTEAHTGMCQ